MAKQKPVKNQVPADNTIYKAMVDMGILMVGIFLLEFINKNYPQLDKAPQWMPVFKWVALVALIPTLLGIGLLFTKKKGLKILGVTLALAGAAVTLASFALYNFWFFAIPYLYFFLIAGCALYLIYILYPHDFFLIALLTTAAGGAFYRHGQTPDASRTTVALYALLILASVGMLVLTYLASRKAGTVSLKGKTLRIFRGKNGAVPLYLTGAIVLACVVASLILGSAFAFYCVYAAVGGLFVTACYYTIRLN